MPRLTYATTALAVTLKKRPLPIALRSMVSAYLIQTNKKIGKGWLCYSNPPKACIFLLILAKNTTAVKPLV
jgi:hypothetical protein